MPTKQNSEASEDSHAASSVNDSSQSDSREEARLRNAAEEILNDEMEIRRVETLTELQGHSTTSSELIIEVSGEHPWQNVNAFAGGRLEEFLERGLIPISIAGREDYATGWFKPTAVGIDVRD